MLSGIGTIGSAAAIIAAGLLGRQAVARFRAEKQAEREIDHAEKALAAAYKVEGALSAIRNPMSSGTELQKAREDLETSEWFKDLSDERKSRTVQANVFYLRIRHFQVMFDEALEALPFVKAYFGNTAGEALRKIIGCRHSVLVYADAYAQDNGQDVEHSRIVKSYVWEGSTSGVDPIASRVTENLALLESILLPVVRSRLVDVSAEK